MNKEIKTQPGVLRLKNGAEFPGYFPIWQNEAILGEVVFTTGMTGYPESLTDPSYTGQLLSFTYPLIGNYGIPSSDKWESEKIHAKGVILSQIPSHWDHFEGTFSLLEWLKMQKIACIMGVDTRALAKTLRRQGSMPGVISSLKTQKTAWGDPNIEHLVSQASKGAVETYNKEKKTVIAIDCGMKNTILHELKKLPVTVKRVPYNYDFTNEDYDGVFISNGPGDPAQCPETVPSLKKAMQQNKPIFGICLGAQLMAIAAGASTYKLPFGHRGHNQPCIDVKTKKCYITSQNHGFAIDAQTLPADWEVSFRNLNDSSVEGIAHASKPFFAVQFHPEATPGPTDTRWLFNYFYQLICGKQHA